jgi:hypothetical protein
LDSAEPENVRVTRAGFGACSTVAFGGAELFKFMATPLYALGVTVMLVLVRIGLAVMAVGGRLRMVEGLRDDGRNGEV